MKTLQQIRELFVSARNLAIEASPAKAKDAAKYITDISDHCKALYETETSYMARAKCRNLFESLDNIVKILLVKGFLDERVGAFFGLLSGRGPSFGSISRGEGTVADPGLELPPIESVENVTPELNEVSPAKSNTPPPPPTTQPEIAVSTPPIAQPEVAAKEPPAGSVPDTPPIPKETGSKAESGNDTIPVSVDDDLEPKYLDDFIGQEHIVRRLKEEIAAAKILGKNYIDHVLLFGNRGLGKSTLMKILSREMNVDFHFMDASSLMNDVKSQRNFNEFFQRIAEKNVPALIAIDEIHMLPTKLQSNMLTLLQDRVYNYLTESGPKTLAMPEFTFIGATTDYNQVLSTLKDRCSNLTFIMVDYTRDQLRRIFINKFKAKGMTVTEDALLSCINRCRSSIRDVTSIVKGLHTKAILAKTKVITKEMAENYFVDRELDPIGLKKKELELLRAIQSETKGFISEETLAARLYLDPGIMTQEYEPHLLKIGFISINSRGRCLTPKAEDYLQYGYFDFGDGTAIGTKPAPKCELAIEQKAPETAKTDPTAPATQPAVEEPAPIVPIAVSAPITEPAADIAPPPTPASVENETNAQTDTNTGEL